MMTKEIKTTETTFDVDEAMAELAVSVYATLGRLTDLYASVNPAIVWRETDEVREARRIAGELKIVIDNFQNTEVELTYDGLDREISRLSNLYASVNPAIVWRETDEVREARRIAGEVKFIVNKLIYVKALGHKIDDFYNNEG